MSKEKNAIATEYLKAKSQKERREFLEEAIALGYKVQDWYVEFMLDYLSMDKYSRWELSQKYRITPKKCDRILGFMLNRAYYMTHRKQLVEEERDRV
jgi:hypothetical protein